MQFTNKSYLKAEKFCNIFALSLMLFVSSVAFSIPAIAADDDEDELAVHAKSVRPSLVFTTADWPSRIQYREGLTHVWLPGLVDKYGRLNSFCYVQWKWLHDKIPGHTNPNPMLCDKCFSLVEEGVVSEEAEISLHTSLCGMKDPIYFEIMNHPITTFRSFESFVGKVLPGHRGWNVNECERCQVFIRGQQEAKEAPTQATLLADSDTVISDISRRGAEVDGGQVEVESEAEIDYEIKLLQRELLKLQIEKLRRESEDSSEIRKRVLNSP